MVRHFHPNCHECYGVFQGSSILRLGVGGGDEDYQAVQVPVKEGDVIVLPAGTSHSSVEGSSKGDYKYVGVYVKVTLLWAE